MSTIQGSDRFSALPDEQTLAEGALALDLDLAVFDSDRTEALET